MDSIACSEAHLCLVIEEAEDSSHHSLEKEHWHWVRQSLCFLRITA